ncbi:MAG: hypothetical protein ABSG83_12400 [Roseiarcus sp.]|jgi:hypothetical protein
MINSDAAVGLSGLLEWSQPVIFDLLVESYEARLEPGQLPRELARLHARLWRVLMAGDMAAYVVLRRNLLEALDECRIDDADLADADARILDELLEIVMSRYQRSMRTAKHYHLALIALAARLAPLLRAA